MKTQELILADPEVISRLDSNIQEIKNSLQQMKMMKQTEYLTSNEFMETVKIGRWKFDALINDGLLAYKKIGRRYYIPFDQVNKYFNGEMLLK